MAFTLSKIAFELANKGYTFPFLTVWGSQELSNEMVQAVKLCAAEVQKVLTSPPASHSNITEWAKQPACWTRVKEAPITLPKEFLAQSTTAGQRVQERKEAIKDTQLLVGIEAQTLVVDKGAQFWTDVLTWAQESHSISPMEASIIGICTRIPSKIPSDKQCAVALHVLARIEGEGFIQE